MTATTHVFTPCLMLSLEQRYHSCHIQLPDSHERVAAIALDQEYYSLFQVVAEPGQAIDMAVRLGKRGERVALRQLPIGKYGLWVKEENARPTRSFHLMNQNRRYQAKPASCYIITSHEDCKSVKITVPDLDQSLSAICFQDRYYSIFKPKAMADQTIMLTAKLVQRGDEIVILALPDQAPHYTVCVIEPDAEPLG